jgi:hypothetical protein
MSTESWKSSTRKITQTEINEKYAAWESAFAEVFGTPDKPIEFIGDAQDTINVLQGATRLTHQITEKILNPDATTNVELSYITNVCHVQSIAGLVAAGQNEDSPLMKILDDVITVANNGSSLLHMKKIMAPAEEKPSTRAIAPKT